MLEKGVQNTPGNGPVISADYDYNSANQRIRNTLADGSYWVYAYDRLGQLTQAVHRDSGGAAIPGQTFGYGYDDIGNRTTTERNGNEADYTVNLLNQYEEREIPGVAEAMGSAATSAVVTVNSGLTQRWQEYFFGSVATDNSNNAAYQALSIVAVLQGAGTNGSDIVSTSTGHVFVAETPETFQYDADGNLLSDGRWTNTWDGENRLIRIETRPDLPPEVPRVRCDYVYDGGSRRVQSDRYTWDGTNWVLAASVRFLYADWLPLAEVNETNGFTRAYTWGSDLSGSLQGAGGVGGLLFVTISTNSTTETFSTAYDGNGNVTGLVGDSGAWAAVYEYDPYGGLLRSTGDMAESNPFRFSTKFFDAETGLYYYGYRLYSPPLGRWLSRDPIGVVGGDNLYVYAGNDPVDRLDPWGLCDVYAVSDMNNGGPRAQWKKVTKAEDVRIYENLSSGSLWGVFYEPQTAKASDDCDVMLPVSILIRRGLADGVLKNHRYRYTSHAPPGNAGRFGVIPDGLAPKEKVIMHERGHAEAFLEFVIPCMQKSLGANKCYSEGRSTEIDNALRACLKDAQYKQASDRYADRNTILYFSGRCRVVERGIGQITWSCE
ncbi:MAG: RHS repeat-associated core domain-containing protein [Kiritimatiellia bacterium]|nr:RHS repeat-associated core domain-containing protein [Kiritimatiellia bacterium]